MSVQHRAPPRGAASTTSRTVAESLLDDSMLSGDLIPLLRSTGSSIGARRHQRGLGAILSALPKSQQWAVRQLCIERLEAQARLHAVERRLETTRQEDLGVLRGSVDDESDVVQPRAAGDEEPNIMRHLRAHIDDSTQALEEMIGHDKVSAILSILAESNLEEQLALRVEREEDLEDPELARLWRRKLHSRRAMRLQSQAYRHATHSHPTRTGNKSVWDEAPDTPEDHMSYYERQQKKYGRGRRGSTAVAGAWGQVFAAQGKRSPGSPKLSSPSAKEKRDREEKEEQVSAAAAEAAARAVRRLSPASPISSPPSPGGVPPNIDESCSSEDNEDDDENGNDRSGGVQRFAEDEGEAESKEGSRRPGAHRSETDEQLLSEARDMVAILQGGGGKGDRNGGSPKKKITTPPPPRKGKEIASSSPARRMMVSVRSSGDDDVAAGGRSRSAGVSRRPATATEGDAYATSSALPPRDDSHSHNRSRSTHHGRLDRHGRSIRHTPMTPAEKVVQTLPVPRRTAVKTQCRELAELITEYESAYDRWEEAVGQEVAETADLPEALVALDASIADRRDRLIETVGKRNATILLRALRDPNERVVFAGSTGDMASSVTSGEDATRRMRAHIRQHPHHRHQHADSPQSQEHLSYYERQRQRYGHGRRGSTAHAGAWSSVFGASSGGSSGSTHAATRQPYSSAAMRQGTGRSPGRGGAMPSERELQEAMEAARRGDPEMLCRLAQEMSIQSQHMG